MRQTSKLRETLRLAGLGAMLLTAGVLATACSRGNNGTATTEIQLRQWRVGQDVAVVQDIADSFVNEHKNVVFSYENKSLDGYELAALKSLAARTGPDVWSIPNDWLGDHTIRLTALPDNFFVTEDEKNPGTPSAHIKKLYPAGIVDQLTNPADGKIYGLPTGVDTLRLYYNPEILSDALTEFRANEAPDEVYQPVQTLLQNPPSTWNALLEQAKYITKRSGETISRGTIALGTADNIPDSADILQLLMMQNGAKVVSTDHRSALFHIPETTPAGVTLRPGENALNFFASFSNPANANYTWNPSMPQAIDAFGQGKVAMVIAFADFGAMLKIKYPEFNFETAPVPQISVAPLQEQINLIRFWVETVPLVADNQIAALTYLRELSKSATEIANEAGLISPFLSVLSADPTAFPNKQILTGQGVFKKHRDQFDQDFRQMIIDVSQNGLTSGKALDSAADKINVLLGQDDN